MMKKNCFVKEKGQKERPAISGGVKAYTKSQAE